MGFGIVEVIALLLGLSGFGLQNNPKAPTPDQALEFAMPDADITAHVDIGAIVPGNYKILLSLADQPAIRSSPDLVKMVKDVVMQVEGGRGALKTMTGLDITTDVSDATVFLKFVAPGKNPDMVLEVHGKFAASMLDKVGKMTGHTPSKIGTGTLVETSPDSPSVALTGSGVLLLGQTSLLTARLQPSWRAPSHTTGTQLGYLADILANHPVFALSLTPSAAAKAEVMKKFNGEKNYATDLVQRHKAAALAVYHDGIGITWADSTKLGLDDMSQTLDGVVDLLRAAQIAPRGVAKIFLGALDSYRGDKRIDDLIRHKADLVKIMESYSGDGNFKVQKDVDAKGLKVTVRLTGKTLSEVVPLGIVAPLAGIGLFVRAPRAMEESMQPQVQPVQAPRPMTQKPAPPPAKRAPQKRSGDPCEGGQ